MHSVFLISLINWIPHTCIVDGMNNEFWASSGVWQTHISASNIDFKSIERRFVPSMKEFSGLRISILSARVFPFPKYRGNPIWSNLYDDGSSGREENPHIIIICWAHCAVYKEIRSRKRVCKCSQRHSCRDENFINTSKNGKLENCVTYHLSHNNFLIISSG